MRSDSGSPGSRLKNYTTPFLLLRDMGSLTVEMELAGVRAQLASSCRELVEYAARHLAPLTPDPSGEGKPRVEATLRWHEGPPPRSRTAAYPYLAGAQRIDRDLYVLGNRMSWFRVDDLRGLHLQFEWDGQRLRIEGDYYYWVSDNRYWERIKRVLFRHRIPALRQRRFTTLLYYLLYYPTFWYVERFQGFHPIHAAGAEVDGAVLVLAGASGVGKSTLAAALAASPGGRLLSDTFLLQRATAVLPVREPILLDERSLHWLGPARRLLQPIQWRYVLNRAGFHWPQEQLSRGGRVAVVLFPCRAEQEYARRLSATEAQGRISAGNVIVNDMRRYLAYAAILEMFGPTPLAHARENELAALTSAAPCYEVGIGNARTREEVVARLLRLASVPPPDNGEGRMEE